MSAVQMELFIRKYLSIVQWVGLGVLITQVRFAPSDHHLVGFCGLPLPCKP